MGNLGAYQAVTTLMKKVGGPVPFAVIVIGAGYIVLRPAEEGARRFARSLKKKWEKKKLFGGADINHMTADLCLANGVTLNAGDEFAVLAVENDEALLMPKHGDAAIILPVKLLCEVSDYRKQE
ncbi:hypothetical protein [Enorma sp.]|uniref:hypothetical protein n=1 Tax=Enorma sp. TaxID=1920692 RepID=UPI0025BEB10E|nr:hypothetical protein [Enorma sp.]